MFEGLRRALSRFVRAIAETELDETKLSRACRQLMLTLIANDVAPSVARELVEHVKRTLIGARVRRFTDISKVVKSALAEYLRELFSVPRVDLVEEVKRRREENLARVKAGEEWIPYRVVFLGPNGHGKTTTVAKCAYLLKRAGFSVVLACSDTFRAGAIEQLEQHAKRLGVTFIRRPYGADPASVAYDAIAHASARRKDVVLIDTAGRLGGDIDLIEEMRKICRVARPDLKVLVVDALAGNELAEQARLFHEALDISGSILTKVDADVRGGAAITLVYVTRRPILYVGVGQRYEDLEPFDPNKFIEMVLGG